MQKLGQNQLTYDSLIVQLNTITPLRGGSRTRHPTTGTGAKSITNTDSTYHQFPGLSGAREQCKQFVEACKTGVLLQS